MEKLTFTIATQNFLDSDNFLRCFWSQLRDSFDNYGWNYWDVKYNNVIDLGMLDIGLKHPIHIKYDYKLKGGINKLFIDLEEDDSSCDMISLLSRCVANAKRNELFIKSRYLKIPIETYYDIQDFIGHSFKIENKTSSSRLILNVQYFDDIDLKQEAAIKTSEMQKFLSLALNSPVFSGECGLEKIRLSKNKFTKELEAVDKFISTHDQTSEIYKKILEAVSLYQNGLKIIYNGRRINEAQLIDSQTEGLTVNFKLHIPPMHQELINIQQRIQIDIELAVVALISSLEVVASIEESDSKVCSNCGQQVFKISQKVKNFSKKYGGKNIESTIKKAYNIRSQIVHVGILLERKEALQKVVNPRVDTLQNGNLLVIAHALPDLLLNDVRFVLLNFIEEIARRKIINQESNV